jgi:hypothetical protein
MFVRIAIRDNFHAISVRLVRINAYVLSIIFVSCFFSKGKTKFVAVVALVAVVAIVALVALISPLLKRDY